jgi:hypothetical protein
MLYSAKRQYQRFRVLEMEYSVMIYSLSNNHDVDCSRPPWQSMSNMFTEDSDLQT